MDRAPPIIFSRQRSAAKWGRARSRQQHSDSASFLLEEMVDDIIERTEFMRLKPKKALIVGDWSMQLQTKFQALEAEIAAGELGSFNEELPASASDYDLIVHLMGLGMVNDLPGALIHARNALAENGLFVAAFPGAGSLPSLRKIALAADGDRPGPRMHPLVDNQAAAALLQRAGFKRQVVDSHTIAVRYRSLDRLVSDLRDHGLTNSLRATAPPFNREALSRAQSAFDAMRDGDGKVTETFEILTLTGWKN